MIDQIAFYNAIFNHFGTFMHFRHFLPKVYERR